MKTLSLVIPVYNNELSLTRLFEELDQVGKLLLGRGVGLELICVDDGSRDASLDELLRLSKCRSNTRVIKLTRNFGACLAVKTGIEFVTGDCFLLLAADLQDPPTLIPEMVDKWLAGAKFIIAEKAGGDGDPFRQRLFSAFYYKMVRLLIDKDYPIWGYNLMLLDGTILPYFKKAGKTFNPSLFAYWLGFRPESIRYERRKREHGRSGWTFSKKLSFFLDSILIYSAAPIRLISAVGLVVSVGSVAYGCIIVVAALLGGRAQLGLFEVFIVFLLGLLITILGMIGEYLWRIVHEVSGHPEAVIEEVYENSSVIQRGR